MAPDHHNQQFPHPPSQQQWMMMPPPQQQQPQQQQPPSGWAQQAILPPPQPQLQQQYVGAAPAVQNDSSAEIKSLWIGDLQQWMDENYINNCFAATGEVRAVFSIQT